MPSTGSALRGNPPAWAPPILIEVMYRVPRTHLRHQIALTVLMIVATSISLFAQAPSDDTWLVKLTAPTTLLAIGTIVYNIGMTRQQIRTLQEQQAAMQKFILETLPHDYMRKDVWTEAQHRTIIRPPEKS